MATNQILVNAYKIDASESGCPRNFTFPATGFQAQAVYDASTGNTWFNTSAATPVSCYGIIERSGHVYLVKETPAQLQALTNA
jgi:hypothetical protein